MPREHVVAAGWNRDQLVLAGAAFGRSPHGVFEVPRGALESVLASDIPSFCTVEITNLPTIDGSPYSLRANVVHAGDPAHGEDISLNVHVGVIVEADVYDLDTRIGVERDLRRAWRLLSPRLSQAGIAGEPAPHVAWGTTAWIGSLLFVKDYVLPAHEPLREALDVVSDAYETLVSTPKIRAFLCHASEDKPFVDRLASRLDASGIEVWYDKREIRVGDSIIERVGQGLSEATHLVVVLSRASVGKPWVMRELSSTLMRQIAKDGVTILPVVTEECDIPPLLADIRYANCARDEERGLDDLLVTLLGA